MAPYYDEGGDRLRPSRTKAKSIFSHNLFSRDHVQINFN